MQDCRQIIIYFDVGNKSPFSLQGECNGDGVIR